MNIDKEAQAFIDSLIEENFGPKQAQIYNSAPNRFKHHGPEFISLYKQEFKQLMEQDGMPIPEKFL